MLVSSKISWTSPKIQTGMSWVQTGRPQKSFPCQQRLSGGLGGSTNRAVGCRSKLSHAWEQQAGGRGKQEAPGTSEAVHRESGAQREVPEGEWEGMRADLYSIIIAAFQAAPAKCLGAC